MMRALHLHLVALVAVLAVPIPLAAQAPAAKAPAASAPAPGNATPAKTDLPTPPPNYEYQAEGRRDPFISLVNKGNEGKGETPAKRADGVPGMLTQEITVRGIVQTRGQWVAMVSGPDGKIYTVRAGDKLADGVVRSVNQTSIVVVQEVNDPLSLEKQREVRKFLRGGEEVK